MSKKLFLIIGTLITLGIAGYFIYTALATSNPHQWTNGLVGYWSFDGQYTTSTDGTRDVSNNGNYGQFKNGVKPVAGVSGQALSFDGVDDYMEISASASSLWNFGTGEFTVEAWFKSDGWTGWHILFDIGRDTTKRGLFFGFNSSGNPRIWWTNALDSWDLNAQSFDANNVSISVWHHIVFLRSGNILSCYIDGIQTSVTFDISAYSNLAWDNTDSDFALGGALIMPDSATSFFKGLVDDVRIYNRALSADEVKQHYDQTRRNLVVNQPSGAPPVGWWKMDEDPAIHNSTIRDYSVNANTGTLTTNDGATNKSADGKIGKALSFDGTDDYVDAGNTASLNITGAITLEAWVKANNPTEARYNTILGKRTADDLTNYEIYIAIDTGKFSFFNGTWDGGAQQSSYVVPAQTWTHLVATVSDGNTNFYANGAFIQTITGMGLGPTNNAPFRIGNANIIQNEWFNGLIDEVRIYNYARTADQIAADYRAGAYRTIVGTSVPSTWWTNGLVGYWNFDGPNTTSTAGTRDTSGNNNWGTFNGGVKPVAGISGQALSFDGVNDYVNCGNGSSLDFGSDNFSIELWIKPNSLILNPFIGKGQAGIGANKGTVARIESVTYKIRWFVRGDSEVSAYSADALAIGSWYHIVLVKSSNMVVYVNTVAGISITAPTGSINSAETLRIGEFGESAQYFNGLIDEVRIYNRALGADEVMEHYQQTRRNINL